jgi:uncharacterized protein YkwD
MSSRPRFSSLVLALAALFALASTVSFAAPSWAAESAPGDPAFGNQLAAEQALLDETNADRATNGLPALDFDAETIGIARARAASQLNVDNLTHYDANGELAFVHLLNDAHLGFQLAGENLARSSTTGQHTVDSIEQALMQSPLHRKNILEAQFNRVAIGAAIDASGRIAFAEIFRSSD